MTSSRELAGFRQQNQAGLEVALGERGLVDFRLQIAAVTETVEVDQPRRR